MKHLRILDIATRDCAGKRPEGPRSATSYWQQTCTVSVSLLKNRKKKVRRFPLV